jgi:hypothetical protein
METTFSVVVSPLTFEENPHWDFVWRACERSWPPPQHRPSSQIDATHSFRDRVNPLLACMSGGKD